MNWVRLIEQRLVEPVLSVSRPLFRSEVAYYETVMRIRAILRRYREVPATASVSSSLSKFDFLKTYINVEHDIMEYGCGSLGLGSHLIGFLQDGNYVGCDISKAAIRQAHIEIADQHIEHKQPKLFYLQELYELLNKLENRTFDSVVVSSVFTHVSLSLAADILDCLSKVLKSGGQILVDFSVPLSGESHNKNNVDYYFSSDDIHSLLNNAWNYEVLDKRNTGSSYYESVLYRLTSNI